MRLLLLAVVALGPASLAAQRGQRASAAYIAPTEATVFTNIEESAGAIRGQTIFINNRSSVPIVVYSAALRDCENVKQSCTPMRLNIKVRPSSRAVLLRVTPKNPLDGFGYNVSFGYRADSSNIEAMRTLANAGSSEAQARLDANERAQADRVREVGAADVYLDEAAITTLGARLARMVIAPESVVVREDRAFLLRDVKLMGVDSSGNPLGRIAVGMRWSLPQTLVLLNRADTLLATGVGRVEIRFTAQAAGRTFEAILPVIVVAEPPLALLSDRTASRRTRRPAVR